jgi:hypothetical protein
VPLSHRRITFCAASMNAPVASSAMREAGIAGADSKEKSSRRFRRGKWASWTRR